MQIRPPHLAERLLACALRDPVEREMVLGDLHEELAGHGRLWYWWTAAGVAAHAIMRHPRDSERPRNPGVVMQHIGTDVRYGLRALLKRPLLTATVALTLGLGLGANAAVFNMVDRMLLRPYAISQPDRVLLLSETAPNLHDKQEAVSMPNFYDWRDRERTMSDLSAFLWWDANISDNGQPERLAGFQVTSGFFEALGARPALGRTFVRDDETPGRSQVVVISDALWQRRFARDPGIVGQTVTIDGAPATIIGVMPPRMSFPLGCEIWGAYPHEAAQPSRRTERNATVIGRLAAERSITEAQSEMSVIAARLADEYPDANRGHGVRIYTINRGMLDAGSGPILGLWQVSALIVLLIACANIANLLLARAAERRRETAVRIALGASRARVIRECLLESVLLALIAVPVALAFAEVCLRAMRSAMPASILRFVPGFESIGVDMRLLAFTIALAVATAGVFGLLPALQSASPALSHTLKEGGRTASGRQLLRRALVVVQISIALPLLAAAGLGVLGAWRFLGGYQGYDPDGLLTMRLVLPERSYPNAAARRHFVDESLRAIEAVSGVQQAAAANVLPATGANEMDPFEIEGRAPADPQQPSSADSRVVTAEYFSLMRIPIVRGRALAATDREETAPVAVISQSMARTYWPNADPLGRRFRVRTGPWMTVVGISGDVLHDWFSSRNAPTMYRPLAQAPPGGREGEGPDLAFVVRTSGLPETFAGSIRRALLRVDSAQPIFAVLSMRQSMKQRTIGLQFVAAIMTVLAGIALVLAVVGLYAVMAFQVAQRRHEIGVRIALGASTRDVLRLTLGQAFRLAGLGGVIGVVLAIAAGKTMESLLLGIASLDARLLGGFALLLLTAALLAAYLPARRAAAIDPIVALRVD